MRAMQPVAYELLPSHPFALRDLGFVMWENVIDPAAVDVDLIAEQRSGHRAALDMPAGTAGSPRRIPFYVAIFLVPRFPQREIPDVFLVVFVVFNPAGRLQLRQIEVGELAVIRKFVDAKIH